MWAIIICSNRRCTVRSLPIASSIFKFELYPKKSKSTLSADVYSGEPSDLAKICFYAYSGTGAFKLYRTAAPEIKGACLTIDEVLEDKAHGRHRVVLLVHTDAADIADPAAFGKAIHRWCKQNLSRKFLRGTAVGVLVHTTAAGVPKGETLAKAVDDSYNAAITLRWLVWYGERAGAAAHMYAQGRTARCFSEICRNLGQRGVRLDLRVKPATGLAKLKNDILMKFPQLLRKKF